ncbi:CbrC family protein, partial [Streptomyces puniciscabiei]|uniref:CbrC family protein n=1 Tax=Streptomyces puniciscabiei TaxID=164348 RepID=UPI003333BFFE
MSGSEMSGVDLARVALRAAMEQARNKGGGQKEKSKPRAVRAVRRDGREPMGLGAAIGTLVTGRAWELPTAGATLRERWTAIAPELAEHVAAVGYDADSGWLTVCPESAAWATKVCLEQARVIAGANELAAARSFAPCGFSHPARCRCPSRPTPIRRPPPTPAGPVRIRETASDGESTQVSRTPGFHAWQDPHWLTHCNDAAAFVGEVGYTEPTAHPEAFDQLRLDLRMSGWHDASQLEDFLTDLGQGASP